MKCSLAPLHNVLGDTPTDTLTCKSFRRAAQATRRRRGGWTRRVAVGVVIDIDESESGCWLGILSR